MCRVNFCRNVPARVILYVLSLTCMVVLHVMRSVMSFAILAMVREKTINDVRQNHTETRTGWNDNSSVESPNYGGSFDWSQDVQYYVMSSFYWTYIIAQVVPALVLQRFGAKSCIGVGTLISSICTTLIPLANDDYILVIILQLTSGFGQGLVWPELYGVISWWIPLSETSRFVSCFQGISLGVTVAYAICGFIIPSFGWKHVFYLPGAIGLAWCISWQFLMYNKPELHPRITEKELRYIIKGREQALQAAKRKVPWLSIIFSLPVWAIAVSGFGRMWIISIATMYGPRYLKNVIGLNVERNGFLSAAICMVMYLCSLIFSYISDKIVTHQVISTIASRKLFTAIGQLIPGILCIVMVYLNSSLMLSVIVWALIQIFTAACFSGNMVNIVDVAPNFTGPVTSLVQIILLSANILSTLVAKTFLQNENDYQSWRNIFNTSAGVMFSTYFLYFMFAKVEVQKWDKTVDSENSNEGINLMTQVHVK